MQGNTEEELPEFLLGTCRLNHLDASKTAIANPWFQQPQEKIINLLGWSAMQNEVEKIHIYTKEQWNYTVEEICFVPRKWEWDWKYNQNVIINLWWETINCIEFSLIIVHPSNNGKTVLLYLYIYIYKLKAKGELV